MGRNSRDLKLRLGMPIPYLPCISLPSISLRIRSVSSGLISRNQIQFFFMINKQYCYKFLLYYKSTYIKIKFNTNKKIIYHPNKYSKILYFIQKDLIKLVPKYWQEKPVFTYYFVNASEQQLKNDFAWVSARFSIDPALRFKQVGKGI